MAVGGFLRASWICLLLFGGGLAFPSAKGYNSLANRDNLNTWGDEVDQLETSPTEMFSAFGPAIGYADRSYKAPLAAAPKQPLLVPNEGAGNQGGGAVEFGQENAKMNDLVKPVTFPLNPTYQLDKFEGGKEPQFASVSYDPSTPLSSKPVDLVFSSSEPSYDPILPPLHQLPYSEDTSTNAHTSEAESVFSSSGGGFGVQDGSQSYSPNLDDLKYPSAEDAQLPSTEVSPANYDSVNAVQPSPWSSASYVTPEEVPAFSNWVQAAPTSTNAQTLEAQAVSSSGTIGGDFSSSQDGSQSYSPNRIYEDIFQYTSAKNSNLPSKEVGTSTFDFANAGQSSSWSSASYLTPENPVSSSNAEYWAQAAPSSNGGAASSSSGITGGDFSTSQNLNFQDDSQSYSPNLDDLKYPSAEDAQLPSTEVSPSNYDSVNAVQPSPWSSASYMTREEPLFSNSALWVQAAPVESPASPSYGTELTLDSTSSEVAAQPAYFKPVAVPQLPSTQQLATPQKVSKPVPSTYIVQFKGGYRRGSKVYSKSRYHKNASPPPPVGLKGPRRGKW
ncbi:hypothetical protein NHX12_032156 [Muraenolepis orangiensis]|uniref:Uncharacterized protein n=1 Tax=Muraenolepis orangiensis TaxID=630683 RepID=A0A9Q0IKC1_9TELE|nr:hypothetical protein NHX12_032156 [Muraenolepis orangiensis]